jgi:histidinol-phosphate aminotransferase
MHLNENPYNLPLVVQEKIIKTIPIVHQYHLDYEYEVTNKLAQIFKLKPENILITNGVDEAVDQVMLVSPAFRIVCAKPGFDGYLNRSKAFLRNCCFLKRSLYDFQLEQSSIEQIGKNDLVFLASPDNPTGVSLNAEQLETIDSLSGRLFIDKTYEDYQTNQLVQFNEIKKNRYYFYSFSKAFCLAGMRLGLLVGYPDDILQIKEKNRFCNIGILPLVSLDAMLDQIEWIQQKVAEINVEKKRLYLNMNKLDYKTSMTQTNFLLFRTIHNGQLQKQLLQYNILVKDTAPFGLNDHLRVSIGLFHQNDFFISVLDKIKNQN